MSAGRFRVFGRVPSITRCGASLAFGSSRACASDGLGERVAGVRRQREPSRRCNGDLPSSDAIVLLVAAHLGTVPGPEIRARAAASTRQEDVGVLVYDDDDDEAAGLLEGKLSVRPVTRGIRGDGSEVHEHQDTAVGATGRERKDTSSREQNGTRPAEGTIPHSGHQSREPDRSPSVNVLASAGRARIAAAVIIVAGLVTPLFGVERARAIVDWWVSHGSAFMRVWGGCALAFGLFLAYAVAPVTSGSHAAPPDQSDTRRYTSRS